MGKSTTTTNSSQSSAAPQASQAYSNLLTQAQGVASTPYQAYTGELTAPVNAQQTAGISGINAAAGQAQPSINQALGIASGAANPLTQQQIQQYQNPYTQDVVNATQNEFNNQNAQQAQSTTGNEIAQGALGGNRNGVAQANLAGQQQLAQAPVIAGLYSNSYNQGLATANQQFQTNPLAAAGSIANFGLSGQNAALTGAGAQLGAGTVQQQTQQAQDTAAQQAYAQQQAYPYQQTQWLAGIDTGVGPGLGSSSTGQTTGPAPNQTAQIAGLGLAAASFLARGGRVGIARAAGGPVQHLAGGGISKTPWGDAPTWIPSMGMGNAAPPKASAPGVQTPTAPTFDYSKMIAANNADPNGLISGPSYGGGNAFTDAYGGSSSNPLEGLSAADYGAGFAHGGGVGYADGGAPDDVFGDDNRAAAYELLRQRAGIQSPDAIPGGESPPSAGVGSAVWNPDQPYRMPDQESVDRWRAGNPTAPLGTPPPAPSHDDMSLTPTEVAAANGAPMPSGMPSEITRGSSRGVAPADAEDDPEVSAYAAPAKGVAAPYTTNPAGAYWAPTTTPPEGSAAGAKADTGMPNAGIFHMSPNARSGLLAAGLGMLASRSSNFGNAVGEGALHGLTAYGAANEHDEKVAQEAAKLSREAQQHAEEMQYKNQTLGENIRHNKATEEKEYKPTLVNDVDPNTGENRHLLFDPNTKKLSPLTVPGTDGTSPKFVSTAAPKEERRKALPASPEARDQSYLDYIDKHRAPGYSDVVKAVADYEIDPNREASLQKGARDQLYRDVKQYDPTYDQTHFQEKQGVIQSFSRGQDRTAVNSLNVSVSHLANLKELGTHLGNGNYPMINRLFNQAGIQTGGADVTNFNAAKEIVGDEVVKAIVGGVNSQADREAIKHLIMAQQSPQQLQGTINTFTSLLAGQLEGRRQGYQAGTGLNNFDEKYLSPETREALTRVKGAKADPNIAKLVYPSGIPQPNTSGSASAPAAIPPATERVVGQTYQTPKGPAKWTAQGWVQ